MFKNVKLLAQLKLNQTKIKHLCVSDEGYLNKLINKPYEALLQANVDTGDNRIYINVAPLFSYIDRGTFTSVDGLKVFFFIGKKVFPNIDDYFGNPVHLGTWHTGMFSTSWNAPRENLDLDKFASLSIEVNGYGFENGKLLNREHFDKIHEEQRIIHEKKVKKETASGHRFLHSNDVYSALEDFFFVHKPYIINKFGAYIFDFEEIGIENFNIKIKSQIIYMGNDLVEKYEADGNTRRSIACAPDFQIPIHQLGDLFLADGSFVTTIFDNPDVSSSFYDEGVSKQDFVNSLKQYWVHRKDWDNFDVVISSKLDFIFNETVVPVEESHGAIFRINKAEIGLFYDEWHTRNQRASPRPEGNPELFLSDEDKSVVVKFINKFMVLTETDDGEIPF